MPAVSKPSDFPRDESFRNPCSPPYRDDEGTYHVFSYADGKHYCLGAELARLETRILLQEGLRRLPGLCLDETRPFERFAGIVDGVTEASFRFDQEAAERIAGTAGRRWAGGPIAAISD